MKLDREHSCDGKRRYHERMSAERAAARSRLQYGHPNMVAYRCLFGAHWHVGHVSKNRTDIILSAIDRANGKGVA